MALNWSGSSWTNLIETFLPGLKSILDQLIVAADQVKLHEYREDLNPAKHGPLRLIHLFKQV